MNLSFSFSRGKVVIVIIVAILLFIGACYFVRLKIQTLYYKELAKNDAGFPASYTNIDILEDGASFTMFKAGHGKFKEIVIYIPDNSNILPHIMNSLVEKYEVYSVKYPSEKHNQNFPALLRMAGSVLNYVNNMGALNQDIIIFGHGVGANVALHLTEDKNPFKALLLLNARDSQKEFCQRTLFYPLCLIVNSSSLGNDSPTSTPVYYFFNENNFTNLEEAQQIFNNIKANEKFFFEIPGEDLDFNFSHLIDFYDNESGFQSNVQIITPILEEQTIEDQEIKSDDQIINGDGLENEDHYID
jgi:hypothetical protein